MKKSLLLVIAGLLMMVSGCSSSDDEESVDTLTVASVYGYMNYMVEGQKAYLVKENGEGNWKPAVIEGAFTYEPGYEYVIKVNKVTPDPGLMDALVYYQFQGVVSKAQKDSEGINPQMVYGNRPQR